MLPARFLDPRCQGLSTDLASRGCCNMEACFVTLHGCLCTQDPNHYAHQPEEPRQSIEEIRVLIETARTRSDVPAQTHSGMVQQQQQQQQQQRQQRGGYAGDDMYMDAESEGMMDGSGDASIPDVRANYM